MGRYEAAATGLGRLLDEKNAAYGDSMRVAPLVLAAIFPNGVAPDQYPLLLAFVRIIDKMNRMASDPEYGGEDPAMDLAGYGLLLASRDLKAAAKEAVEVARVSRGDVERDSSGVGHIQERSFTLNPAVLVEGGVYCAERTGF